MRSRREFETVFREGKRRAGRNLVVHALRQDAELPTRVGLAVTRRVGSAVERNRVRRRLREVLRSTGPWLRPGFACIVVARPEARTASWGELGAECFQILERLGVLDPWWEKGR